MKKYSVFIAFVLIANVTYSQNSFPSAQGNPVIKLQHSSDGISAYGWLEYYDVNSRMGYVGFGSASTNNFHIHNETEGNLSFNTGGSFLFLNGKVGIGVNSPSERLSISNSISIHGSPNLAKLIIESNDANSSIDITARKNNTVANQPGRDIRWLTRQNQEVSMILNKEGKLAIGTTDLSGDHMLRVEGSIGARAIKVQANGWADFVFKNEYKLQTLEEVEQHIIQKGHLPEIPSEAEVVENGIDLGELNTRLLQKIEELTLYLIEQNKELKIAKTEILELKEKVDLVESKYESTTE